MDHNLRKIGIEDENVFNHMFVNYYKPLCNYAYRYVNDMEAAREITQGVFVKFWEKASFNEAPFVLKSYLYASVRNACIDYLKHNRLHQEYRSKILLEYADTYDDHFEQIVAKELSNRIEEAVSMLPPQCQKIFRLSRFEYLKNKEIADELNISLKAVEAQISKALHFLKEQLSDYYFILLPACLLGFLFLFELSTHFGF
jgi:RNA polymerase sigma-70 factor (ECF subfamily)